MSPHALVRILAAFAISFGTLGQVGEAEGERLAVKS